MADAKRVRQNLRSKHIRTLEVLQSTVDENTKLKEELEKSKDAREENQVLRQQLADAQERNHELHAKLEKKEEEDKRYAEKVGKLEYEITTLRGQLKSRKAEITGLKLKLKRGNVSNDKVDKITRERDEALLKVKSSTQQIKKLQAQCVSLAKQMEELQRLANHSKLEEVIAQLKKTNVQLVAENAERQKKIQILTTDCANLRKKFGNMSKRAAQNQAQCDVLTDELTKLRRQLANGSDLNGLNEQLQIRCDDLEDALRVLEPQYDLSLQRISALEAEIRRLNELLEEHRDLKKGAKFAKFVSLKHKNRELNSKLTELKNKNHQHQQIRGPPRSGGRQRSFKRK